MSFTVVWSPSAEQKLADLWVHARDRKRLSRAADAMEAALRRNPSEQGESRVGPVRIAIFTPLAVHFEVNEPDRLVRVLDVWRSKRRP